ncbi:MAG: hypothetical protein HQ567_11315 [Candidatus Nealsonbacteria bacterium]|nr:hypothetical protein [Candidatus Nealsonbacteria bacterium]
MRFVIDSSVMQAAGRAHPVDKRPKRCRGFLDVVYGCNHRVVVTDEIETEWRQHSSRVAVMWQRRMRTHRKIWRPPPDAIEPLTDAIAGVESNRREQKLMQEDLFLLEAALAADKIVTSLDKEVHGLFRNAAKEIPKLRRVIWVDLDEPDEDGAKWVSGGVSLDPERMLGSSHE